LTQARGIQLALLLTVPSVAGAVAIPDLVMRALFARGAFTAADAAAAGATLAAYAIGLLPFVMMRSFTAPFYARGDTLTPVKAALLAAGVNIAFKVMLMGPLAQVGLAFATSIGAWINLSLLTIFARRRGFAVSGAGLRPVIRLLLAGAGLAGALYLGNRLLTQVFARLPYFREEITLVVLLVIGVIVYVALVLLLLGRGWLQNLFKDVGTAAEAPQLKLLEPPDPTEASAALPDNPPPPTV
jgi:putative peptidoglycan lipid II flippase